MKKNINTSIQRYLQARFWCVALAGIAQWLEHHPRYQRVLGLILSQGHIPVLQVCSPGLVGHMWEATNLYVYLTLISLSLSLPSSLFSTLAKKAMEKYPLVRLTTINFKKILTLFF